MMNEHTHLIKVALIGSGTSRSRTPAMHMAEGKALGINYSYVRFDTLEPPYSEMSLPELLNLAESEGYAGVNVTHPFKMEVLQYLDDLSAEAKILKAVNTVVFLNGKRMGFNTDYTGFRTAFKNNMANVAREHVLLLGSGGAGSAVALALTDCGVKTLSVFDQSTNQAIELTNRLSPLRPNTHMHVLESISDVLWNEIDGVVNTTPMGMEKYPGTAIEVKLLQQKTWVADIVYFPLETELLKQAKDHGCLVMNGSGMTIGQAVDAFRHFTGLEPDAERFVRYFHQLFNQGIGV